MSNGSQSYSPTVREKTCTAWGYPPGEAMNGVSEIEGSILGYGRLDGG